MTVKERAEVSSAAHAVRTAFSNGISSISAAAFLEALDAGLGWEPATAAVAAGLAEHYGTWHMPPRRSKGTRHRAVRLFVGALVVYVVLRPLLGFAHELTVAALASMLHLAVAAAPWESLIGFMGLDPIYAGAAIRAVGGVQVAGFAVAGPIGTALHGLLPGVFLAIDQVAPGAAVSMVATPGTAALGRGLATFGADIVWLSFGLWLFWRWRRRSWSVALLGLLIQAQIGINHLLEAHIALTELDASGLPFAIQLAMPNGGWLTASLASLPIATRAIIMGLILLIVGYACALVGLVCATGVASHLVRCRRKRRTRLPETGWTKTMKRSTVAAGVVVALATAWSPIGALAMGTSNWHATAGLTSLGPDSRISPSAARKHSLRLTSATPVSIVHQSDGSWQYVVDGTADTIRGVGYNPWYAGLSPAQRAALYDRDFSDMHRLGINTIEGWFENQFDNVTLDAAARNGIGVLMPFELNQDWDYTNPNVQASILEHITEYVDKYKDHPAVRMWAPGNENLHRILYAHWVSQANNPQAVARAEAFAEFLPVLVDHIHQLDPNHPVVYRDAEDVYLPWISGAFTQAGGSRPWLVYGANIYSQARMQQIISSWPSQWPGQPLLISEFAPGGMSAADRPLAFEQQWQVIRSRPNMVLGGLAYTWATNGPENLDRIFGLVDPNGVPTDGGLAALSAEYLSDTAIAQTAGGS